MRSAQRNASNIRVGFRKGKYGKDVLVRPARDPGPRPPEDPSHFSLRPVVSQRYLARCRALGEGPSFADRLRPPPEARAAIPSAFLARLTSRVPVDQYAELRTHPVYGPLIQVAEQHSKERRAIGATSAVAAASHSNKSGELEPYHANILQQLEFYVVQDASAAAAAAEKKRETAEDWVDVSSLVERERLTSLKATTDLLVLCARQSKVLEVNPTHPTLVRARKLPKSAPAAPIVVVALGFLKALSEQDVASAIRAELGADSVRGVTRVAQPNNAFEDEFVIELANESAADAVTRMTAMKVQGKTLGGLRFIKRLRLGTPKSSSSSSSSSSHAKERLSPLVFRESPRYRHQQQHLDDEAPEMDEGLQTHDQSAPSLAEEFTRYLMEPIPPLPVAMMQPNDAERNESKAALRLRGKKEKIDTSRRTLTGEKRRSR